MKKRHYKGIYLLPNAITLTSLFLGFYAIINAFQGSFQLAIPLIMVCVVLDGIDGSVARMLKMESHFGAALDSLTDAVVFGVAPALIVYQWLMLHFAMTVEWERGVWLITSFYVASTVLRLARFNVQTGTSDKGIFQGLPSPAAAALVMSFMWCTDDSLRSLMSEDILFWTTLTLLVLSSAAMLSRFSYYSLKQTDLNSKVRFISLCLIAVVLTLAAMDISRFLLAIFLIYALSAPTIYFLRSVRKQRRNKKYMASNWKE